MEQINANFGLLFTKLDMWVNGFIELLPNIIVGIVVFFIFWALSRLVRSLIYKAAVAKGRHSLGEVAGAMTKWAMLILGFMLAVTIILPSIKPGDLISGLGISSVAIGFAFKDILQNMLAGILILLRQPFSVGDQIVSGGHEGTVEKIETRATLIKTYDGRRVVIPNSDIYTDSVIVNTAFDKRRSQYDIGVGCNDNWQQAREIMIKACAGVEGVLPDPAPEAIPVDMGDFANIIRLRWWTKSDKKSQIHVQGDVIQTVYQALDEAGIDMPYPTYVHLWHDQTDEFDGNRAMQREGWPAAKDKSCDARSVRTLKNAPKSMDMNP